MQAAQPEKHTHTHVFTYKKQDVIEEKQRHRFGIWLAPLQAFSYATPRSLGMGERHVQVDEPSCQLFKASDGLHFLQMEMHWPVISTP